MGIKYTKLTRINMRKLKKSGEKITESGIVFERLSNGDGRFSVNVMVDGQRIHRVIGKESERVTRKQAEVFIEQARHDARHDRLRLPKGRKSPLSFIKASLKYIDNLNAEGGKDIPKKQQRLFQHLVPFFNHKPLSKISSFEVERYKKFRKDQGVAPGTINRELAVLSHIFTKSVEWGWIDHRPAKLNRMKEDKGRIVYLTAVQVERLLEAARYDENAYIYLFILIGLETSMRRSEILSIRTEYIDSTKQMIYIPNAKAGPREQPMTPRLSNYLNEYLGMVDPNQEWLFPSQRSRTGHTMNIEKTWKRVVVAAGLDPREIVRHTLRHTAITHLVQSGVDLPTVKRISGHKTLSMVERYSHQNGEHIRSAMERLQDHYEFSTDKVS